MFSDYFDQNIPEDVYREYVRHKFVIYDHAEEAKDLNVAFKRFPDLLKNNQNLALFSLAAVV